MVIYADILVLVNMYVDYFLLLAVGRYLHLKARGLRLFLASLLGGLTGLLAFLPVAKAIEWLLLFLSAVIICAAAFGLRKWRLLIKSSCCLFIFSLILSGAVFLLTELTGIRAAVVSGRVYFDISPLLLLFFTVAVYLVSLILEKLLGPRDDVRNLNFTVIETPLGKAEILMKTDTGNSLHEPFSGLPAAVVELDALLPILPASLTEYFGGGNPREGLRLIPCSTLGGSTLLPAFRPEKFYLKEDKSELNCYIAVTKSRLSSSSWKGLLSPEILDQRRSL